MMLHVFDSEDFDAVVDARENANRTDWFEDHLGDALIVKHPQLEGRTFHRISCDMTYSKIHGRNNFTEERKAWRKFMTLLSMDDEVKRLIDSIGIKDYWKFYDEDDETEASIVMDGWTNYPNALAEYGYKFGMECDDDCDTIYCYLIFSPDFRDKD